MIIYTTTYYIDIRFHSVYTTTTKMIEGKLREEEGIFPNFLFLFYIFSFFSLYSVVLFYHTLCCASSLCFFFLSLVFLMSMFMSLKQHQMPSSSKGIGGCEMRRNEARCEMRVKANVGKVEKNKKNH
jgi:hypothetical protein